MLGALSRGGVLKMVALADQGMSGQTKSQLDVRVRGRQSFPDPV